MVGEQREPGGSLLTRRWTQAPGSIAGLAIILALFGCGQTSGGAPAPVSAPPPEIELEPAPQETGVFLPLPELPGGARARHQLTLSGAGLILTGGHSDDIALDDILAYNAFKNRFETLPIRLEQGRFGHSATRIPGPDGIPGNNDDAILIIGGYNGQRAIAGVEIIHPDPDGNGDLSDARIQSLPPLPFGLVDHIGILALNPKDNADRAGVFVMGGLASEFDGDAPSTLAVTSAAVVYQVSYLRSIEAVGEVDIITQPFYARRDHSVTLLPGPDGRIGSFDDRLFIFGGRGFRLDAPGDGKLQALVQPELYEPARDRWTTISILGDPGLIQGRYGHRAVRFDGRLLIVAGTGDQGPSTTALWLDLDPDNLALAEISEAGQIQTPRQNPEVAWIDAGHLLLAGGFEPTLGAILDSVEIYDVEGESFYELDSGLTTPRVFHALQALGPRVIVTGGLTGSATLKRPDVELFINPR